MSTEIDEKQTTNIYIYSVHPLLVDDSLVWDIFYITENNYDVHCIRVFNVELSFMIARLPGLTEDQFQLYIQSKLQEIPTDIHFRNDLHESEYFTFGRNRTYAEVFSNNPRDIAGMIKTLKKELHYYYKRIDERTLSKMNSDDQLFYRNTETPLRY